MTYQDAFNLAKNVIEYPPAQVAVLVFGSTQFIKQFVAEHKYNFYNSYIRLLSVMVGIVSSLVLISSDLKGVFYGIAISTCVTIVYKLLTLWLNRKGALGFEKKISLWLSGNQVS